MSDYDDERRIGPWIGYAAIFGLIVMTSMTLLQDRSGPQRTASAATVATTTSTPTTSTTTASTPADAVDRIDPTPTTDAVSETTDAPATDRAAAPTTEPITETTTAPTASPATGVVDEAVEVEVTPTSEPIAATLDDPALGYPAAADGTPLPAVVTYDSDSVRLAGVVPSDEARARLTALAVANSRTPDITVVDGLIVNPDVPASVGVRVIEKDSPRFGEGDIALSADHAAQIDRVANVLRALPHVSVMVIGHADQRGDDLGNLALSEARASSVVDYLTYLGIEPTRISMRGAGETDLLTLDDDDAALALNRRTEFVFSGILL